MNKYVTQLLEVIQKKTGCDTSSAVRWLAERRRNNTEPFREQIKGELIIHPR